MKSTDFWCHLKSPSKPHDTYTYHCFAGSKKLLIDIYNHYGVGHHLEPINVTVTECEKVHPFDNPYWGVWSYHQQKFTFVDQSKGKAQSVVGDGGLIRVIVNRKKV